MCLGPQHYYYVRLFKHLKHLDCTVQHIVCVHSLFLVFMKKVRQINTHTRFNFKTIRQPECLLLWLYTLLQSQHQLKECKKKKEKHANNQRPIYLEPQQMMNCHINMLSCTLKSIHTLFPVFPVENIHISFSLFLACVLCFPYLFQLSTETATLIQQL